MGSGTGRIGGVVGGLKVRGCRPGVCACGPGHVEGVGIRRRGMGGSRGAWIRVGTDGWGLGSRVECVGVLGMVCSRAVGCVGGDRNMLGGSPGMRGRASLSAGARRVVLGCAVGGWSGCMGTARVGGVGSWGA